MKIKDHSRFQFHIDQYHRIAVEGFFAEERISMPFNVNLSLVSEDQIHFKDGIGKGGYLTITGKEQDRFFHGIINNFTLTGEIGHFYTYQANLVPSVWLMGINQNYRIFQNMTVAEIVKKLLDENRKYCISHEFRLVNKYEKKRNCTQYGESDLRFICRILEEEGIFYFFEHSANGHKIVFADSKIAYQPIPEDKEISFCHDAGLVPDREVIDGFSYNRSISPGKVTHTNYNFKRPTLDMTVVEKGETHVEHEIYEYPGDYGLPPEGGPKVKTRLQGKKALEESVQGTSNCARFIPGYTFTVSGHTFRELNKEYCLVTVAHSGSQPNVYGEYSGIGGDYSYSNSFLAIPSTVTYRPERTLAKPFVKGLQTAVVAGPPGEEIYPDEYGRVKVQFHWDREGQRNERSSCWLRISQPWSGQSWGMISIPRVGDEVLVDFINGDPDWPIVVGSVNNAQSPALYPLPDNKTRSGIRTRSYPNGSRDNFHELRFEDKKGSEEIYLQSEKDWNILVKNNKAQNVGHDEALQVGNNRLKTVGVDQMEQVGRNHSETIGANKTVAVGSNKNETVAMNSAESIGLAKELTVGGVYQVSVAGAMNETVLGAKAEEVGITKQVVVGSHMTERVAGNRSLTVGEELSATVKQSATVKAKTIILEADEEIILRSGSATIVLKSNGQIVMQGTNCTQLASGEIVIKGAKTSLN